MHPGFSWPGLPRAWRALLVVWFAGWAAAAAAQTSISPGDPALLEAALRAGGTVAFDSDGTTTLTHTLVISNNVTLDGGGFDVIISGGSVNTSSTNISTNVLSQTICVTNLVLTNIIVTNFDGTLQTNLTVVPVVNCATVQTTNITTNVIISATGQGLFAVKPGVQFTVANLTLTRGLRASGGGILNQGVLLATNCVFTGNVALGTNGPAGANGASSTTGSGKDGLPGGAGENGLGGAIYNSGAATVLYCRFATNMAIGGSGGNGGNGGDGAVSGGDGANGGKGGLAQGGAIYNSGTLTLRSCMLETNLTLGGNGGFGGTNGSATFPGLTGKGGAGSQAAGAGLYNTGTALLEACTFADHRILGGDSRKAGSAEYSDLRDGSPGGSSFGGAICNLGHCALVNCTVYHCQTAGGAGGDGGDAASGSLFYGNGGNGGNAWGGGVFNSSWLGLTNCTLSDSGALGGTNGLGGSGAFPGNPGNPGVSRGGNLANSNGTCYVKNTILAYATRGSNAYGAVLDAGYNISSDPTPTLSGTGSKLRTDPRLGFLADNGGPVQTVALETNSPAINKADPVFVLATDARGITRPQAGRGDIGAYELESACLSGRVTLDGVGLLGVTLTVGGSETTTTEADGRYAFTNLAAGPITVVPTLAGYDFTPPVRAVVIGPTPTNADFTATGIFNISGRVTLDGAGLAGVKIASGPHQALSGADGFYSLGGIAFGNPTVTASLPGYVFVPSNQVAGVTNFADVNGLNFEAVPTFKVAGGVFDEVTSAGRSNVLISVFVTNITSGLGIGAWALNTRTDRNGHYVLTNVPAGEIVIRPSLTNYAFIPDVREYLLNADVLVNDFVAFRAYTISGRVTVHGQGLEGVMVEADFGFALAETDAQGYYTLFGLAADSYEVTATLDGYAITPESISVTVGPNKANVNFTAEFSSVISGYVTLLGAGVPGVSVAVGSTVVVTDPSGHYEVPNLPPGDYTITPYAARYAFTPPEAALSLPSAETQMDFVAQPLCNINGRITFNGAGLPGVTVTANDQNSTTATTDSNGYYSLVDVVGGETNRVTPTLTDYGFTPSSRTLFMLSNTFGVDFVASVSLSISGRVKSGTNFVAGVIILTTGATNATSVTDANGYYIITDLRPGSYTLTPQPGGVGFEPGSTNLVLTSSSVSSVNFSRLSLGLAWNVGGNLILTLTGVPVRPYKILSTTNLNGSPWVPVFTNYTAYNGTYQWPTGLNRTNVVTNGCRFYRGSAP